MQRERDEQLRCRDWLDANGHGHNDSRLARMGASDWVMEEVLIMIESKDELSQTRYKQFLDHKSKHHTSVGFDVPEEQINLQLFDWQCEVTRWALRKGRAALFEGCGCGKTPQSLEWARRVVAHSPDKPRVLIVAPLSVAEQTHEDEAPKFGYQTTICRSQTDVRDGINITNYEMLEHFDASQFVGVVLDESSILKSFTGKIRNQVIEMFGRTPYRLCCTATPAPNDYMELGNHAEFLGVMTRVEMLSMFFIHDGRDTGQWRLKGHAEEQFWKWVCSWAVVIRTPSDIGFSDEGYNLPPINRQQITIPADGPTAGMLFPTEASTLQERRAVRRDSIDPRVQACAKLVNASTDQWIVWCGLNDESTAITKAIPGAVELTGSKFAKQTREYKVEQMRRFQRGEIRVVVTKVSMFGFGMNLQNCYNWAYMSLSDSFEQMHQADRRCWRFGQQHPCTAYVIVSELEGAVIRNIERKEQDYEKLNAAMVEHMRDEMNREVRGATVTVDGLEHDRREGLDWTAILGDSVDELRQIPDGSIHYSIFSPPFASLYTYSASERDLGNCTDAEFMQHMQWIVEQLARVMMPGRLVSFHCMNLPSSKERDGFIGVKDFRGDLIRLFQTFGFIYHSEVVIWKDPLVAASRTHALGLAHKQIVKDASMCRQGIPDYLVTMRAPGVNAKPVEHKPRGFERYIGLEQAPKREKADNARDNKYSHEVWQRYASPVWMDIDPSDTLQRESAREQQDERHICPLQLQVIERAIELWTNPGEVVLSPFMGIGSEGYVAIRSGRRFIGIELKRSYWEQAHRNLANAVSTFQPSLFDGLAATAGTVDENDAMEPPVVVSAGASVMTQEEQDDQIPF